MFTIDVPYVSTQETPIVLVQAATPSAGSATQPDYLLKICQETESTGDPRSAMRSIEPAGWLADYLGYREHRQIDTSNIKTTLLEGVTHGKITNEVDNTGRFSYGYDPIPEYVGKDRAVFMAEFEGKHYKIVIDLHVFIMVDENKPTCTSPQLIKITKPATGSSGYNMSSISISYQPNPSLKRDATEARRPLA